MKILRPAALLAGALAVHAAPAADLDVFSNGPNATGDKLPNVLIIIDNTANWNTAFTNEKQALATVLAELPVNKYNVGIMLQTESGTMNPGPAGGYIRAAIRPLTYANKQLYVNLVNSFDRLADKGTGGSSGLSMAEAYRYFMGIAPYAGNTKAKADFTGNSRVSAASDAIYRLGGNALNSFSETRYNPPAGACVNNYIIYISNGANQQSSYANSVTNSMLAAAAGGGSAGGAAIAQIPLMPSGSQENPMDEWARFMRKSSLAVTTYTIDVDPVPYGAGPGWTALLKSAAGSGNYAAVTSGSGGIQIADAIRTALTKIQSVNSVFASPALPLAPNANGAYLNQVYLGMFRPDPDARPRWMGNLKQYRLNADTLSLTDTNQIDVLNPSTGFIHACARSAWTPIAFDTYWASAPQGACLPYSGQDPATYAISNSPDGDITEKGGQAFRLRQMQPYARRVTTCMPWPAPCNNLLNFDAYAVSPMALGVTTTYDRDVLIDWAKGMNNLGELGKSNTVMRPSAHGDVIHSRPLALTYNSGWQNDVVVFYGSNDGMLHAINGNREAAFGNAAAGDELWSFMAPEFLPHIKRLRNNSQLVSFAGAIGSPATGTPKPYGIDGPLTSLRENGSTWIYAAMRRGGRALYSFDVSAPATPALKWRMGCGPDGSCTEQASGMGQTWSAAQPIKTMAGNIAGPSMLIMGGGYDNCEDTDIHTCSASSTGRRVYILDANSGSIIKTFDTERGVAGDLAVVTDAEGYVQFAYAADLGGNVYRIKLGYALPSAWSITKIAALGCDTPSSNCGANRKFLSGPSVVADQDGGYSVYLGSGDREKPLGGDYFPATSAVANYFFKITDKPWDPAWLASEGANCGSELICLASFAPTGSPAGTCGATVRTGKGWAMSLAPGEQVVTPAATRHGVTTFSTHVPHVPHPYSCGATLGTVKVYNIDTELAQPAPGSSCSDFISGGGLPPAPQKFDLCVDAACAETRPVCIGCLGSSAIQPKEDPAPAIVAPPVVAPAAQPAAGWTLK